MNKTCLGTKMLVMNRKHCAFILKLKSGSAAGLSHAKTAFPRLQLASDGAS